MITFEIARDDFLHELRALGCDVCPRRPTTIRDARGNDTGVSVGMDVDTSACQWFFRLHPEHAPMVVVREEPRAVAKALAKCGIQTA